MNFRNFVLCGAGLFLAACGVAVISTGTPTAALAGSGFEEADQCSFNGIELFGKVKVVERDGDIRIQLIRNFADLDVNPVPIIANTCGEWSFVERREDFTVQFVTSNPDITVEFVRAFPGMR